jgi:tripartite-type tricarboxylate transporter receptor subunit TctC
VQLTSGVVAPAGTPEAIVAKLAAATGQALKNEKFAKALEAAGLEAQADASPAFARNYLDAERKRLAPIIKAAGLEPT